MRCIVINRPRVTRFSEVRIISSDAQWIFSDGLGHAELSFLCNASLLQELFAFLLFADFKEYSRILATGFLYIDRVSSRVGRAGLT